MCESVRRCQRWVDAHVNTEQVASGKSPSDHPHHRIKRDPELVGFKRTQSLALEAVKRPLTNAQREATISALRQKQQQ